jgi:transposase
VLNAALTWGPSCASRTLRKFEFNFIKKYQDFGHHFSMSRSHKDRAAVQIYLDQGLTWTAIQRKLQCSTRFIQRWKGGQDCFDDKPRSGRSRFFDSTAKKVSLKHRIGKRGQSTRHIASFISSKGLGSVSHVTVWRQLKADGAHPFHRVPQPKLNPKQKQQRRRFANDHTDTQWSSVLFSDEKHFRLYSRPNVHNDVVWAYDSEQVPAYEVQQYGPEVRVWAAAARDGRSQLHFYEGGLTSENYIKILDKSMLPAAEGIFDGSDYIFQQDNATAHSATDTQEWLQEHVPDFFDKDTWPAKSPDLNIMENIWAWLAAQINLRKMRTTRGLKKALAEEWEKLPPAMLKHLVASMPGRVQRIIECRGAATKSTHSHSH